MVAVRCCVSGGRVAAADSTLSASPAVRAKSRSLNLFDICSLLRHLCDPRVLQMSLYLIDHRVERLDSTGIGLCTAVIGPEIVDRLEFGGGILDQIGIKDFGPAKQFRISLLDPRSHHIS